jgi:hypothetical protein
MAKKLTSEKARKILHDKSVHGKPLTEKQRKFFGAIAGGAEPYKAQIGTMLTALPSNMMDRLSDALGFPQKAVTKLVTGKYQTPSEAMGITNPIGAFATDAVLDPMNLLLGAGSAKASKASKAIKPASKVLRAAELSKVTGLTNKMKDYSKSVMPTAKKAAPVKKAGINPLAIADEIIPMPLAPQNLLGMPGGWMELSPMNLVPGYGSKLSAKSAYPNFIGFRKFGNSLDDVIERQALSPKGGSPLRMGRSQIVSEGNWAAVGAPDENYKGVFAATMNPQVEGSNILLQRIPNRYGILGTTKEGNVDIPLTDPGLSFSRRLPFSTRYVPVNKQKLINNEFQLATMSPRLQSLAEKYGVGLGLATLFGATDLYNKYTIDPIKEQLGNLFESDTQDDKKKNGGWLDKYDMPQAQNGIEGTMGGLTDIGFNYNGAWNGPSMQMGGSLPGAVGFMYARTQSPAPSNGPYAKKTKASAQNGMEMSYYQHGLDFKPKTISQDGSDIPVDPMGYWNPENVGGPVTIPSNVITMEGVDQPLLGISDTGDIQYMEPGEDYEFDGEYVTEYPMAKGGVSVNNADAQPLKKLDQLLNFTNYNKPTKGGWLDKYQ